MTWIWWTLFGAASGIGVFLLGWFAARASGK